MKDDRPSNSAIITWLVTFYLVAALIWWTVLLLSQNKQNFELQQQIFSLQAEPLSGISDIQIAYKRQKLMILGEGAVFIIALGIGTYFINKYQREELNITRQKQNFLLAITHELKSPISSIQLSLETLRKRIVDQKQFDKISYNALKETKRLEALVEELLLSARLDKSYEVVIQQVNLKSLFEDMIQDFEHKYPKVDFKYSMDNKFKYQTVGLDSFAIKTIINNLVDNGVRYNQEDHKQVDVNIELLKNQVSITIKDNGDGIPEQLRNKVVKPFYRLGSEERRSAKGTGLGLYIVSGLVDANKGKFKISSNSPRGTKITITLPIHDMKA